MMDNVVLERSKWVFDGERMQNRRRYCHLTQKQLARRTNLTQCTISKYESGNLLPSIKNLLALAIALSTSADYLLGLTSNPTPSFTTEPAAEPEQDLLRTYYALPVEKRERVMGMLLGAQEG